MATKAEMAAAIAELTGADPINEIELKSIKSEDLEKMLEEAKAKHQKPELMPARRKINRGSTRRINRAHEAVDAAMNEFIKEIGIQAFLADEDGERAGDHPLVGELKKMQAHIRIEVFKITNPEPVEAVEDEPAKEPDPAKE